MLTTFSYEQHPIGACYPPLTSEAFENLKALVRANHNAMPPAILYEDKILDGWHYYKACLEEVVEPRFQAPLNIGDPYDFVTRRHEGRRHLTTGQRAVVAERMATLKRGTNRYQDKSRSANAADLKTNSASAAVKEAAKLNKVGATSVAEARYAKENGIPEIYQALKDGKLKSYRAKEIAQLPKAQQAEALKAELAGDKRMGNRRHSGTQKTKSAASGSKPLPPWEPIKFPTAAETGFPINGTLKERDAHHRKYGRTPMFPKEVKDMMNNANWVDGYVVAILAATNETHPTADQFFTALDAMLAWVPRPEKGDDYKTNYAARARKELELLKDRLPKLIDRLTKLKEALDARK